MRMVPDRSLAFAPRVTMAQRFWEIAPQRRKSSRGGGPATAVVTHLVGILRSLRDADLTREHDTTVATLSLVTMLRQQEASGDLNYASPEQLRGEMLTESSLAFSVAVLLFERLCERHPFSRDESPLRLLRMRRGELGSGVNFFPSVPTPLRAVMQRALSSRPEDRPQTLNRLADELVDQLPALIESERAIDARAGEVSLPVAVPLDGDPLSIGEQIGRLLEHETVMRDDELRSPPVDVAWFDARKKSRAERATVRVARSQAWREHLVRFGLAASCLAIGLTWHLLRGSTSAESNGKKMSEPSTTAVQPSSMPARAAAARPVETELVAPSPLPYFDPELAAAEATEAANRCFPLEARRGAPVDFGLSMLFAPASPRATKVYFPSEPELDAEHTECLARVLRGVSAGGSPAQPRAVECRFRVGADGIRAVVRRTVP